MWWRHPFVGHPDEVEAMARKLVEHKHSGSSDDDVLWGALVDDLRENRERLVMLGPRGFIAVYNEVEKALQ